MDITHLPIGEVAEPEEDCIRIQQLQDGTFMLSGSVLLNCGDVETAESVGLITSEPYGSYEAAEAAGLAWANDHCVGLLHVCRSDGTEPLPDPA
jgi:hypothetical protein